MNYDKKVKGLSNRCYNEGLELAKVRDLSGAVAYLKQSLKYNKNNTDARNLLGLVYFEMGETVEALAQWHISQDLNPGTNRAKAYLPAIESDKNLMNSSNQAIKKYNQALLCCQQGNWDIAGIHMKKVLLLNPRMVKGYQLLALIALKEGRPEDAKKALKNAARIDLGNPQSFRYAQELNQEHQMFQEEKPAKKSASAPKKNKKAQVVSYQSGNETIIRPAHFKDNSARTTIVHIAIGLVIGAALTAFLLIPGIQQNFMGSANETLQELSETVAVREQTIRTLELQLEQQQARIAELEEAENARGDVSSTYQNLMLAVDAAQRNDMAEASRALESVNPDYLSEDMKSIYDTVFAKVSAQRLSELYREGKAAFDRRNYELAVEKLQEVVNMDETYQDSNAVFYLAQAYERLDDDENAAIYYQKVIDQIPGTQRATTARNFLRNFNADTNTNTNNATNNTTNTTNSTNNANTN